MTSDADLIELWEDAHRALLTPVVITEYLRYLRELAKWLPDELDKSLRDARREDLAEFQAVQTRWSPSTRQTHCRRGIRSFYAWLFNAGLIGENPADDLPKIEVPDAVVRVADDRTRDALVAVATLRDRAIIEVLFDSGAHRGQVAALTIDDVDIDEHVVLIRGAPTPGRGRRVARVAPLSDRATAALSDWIAARGSPATDALWTKTTGTALSSHGLKSLLKRLSRSAGVPFSALDARRRFVKVPTEWEARLS